MKRCGKSTTEVGDVVGSSPYVANCSPSISKFTALELINKKSAGAYNRSI